MDSLGRTQRRCLLARDEGAESLRSGVPRTSPDAYGGIAARLLNRGGLCI